MIKKEDDFQLKRGKMLESALKYCKKKGGKAIEVKIEFPYNDLSKFLKKYQEIKKQARENIKKDNTLWNAYTLT
jgi:hypothetical protein